MSMDYYDQIRDVPRRVFCVVLSLISEMLASALASRSYSQRGNQFSLLLCYIIHSSVPHHTG